MTTCDTLTKSELLIVTKRNDKTMNQKSKYTVSLLSDEEYKAADDAFQKFLSDNSLAFVVTPKYIPCENEAGAKTVGEISFVKRVEVREDSKNHENVPSPFVSPAEPAA